MKDKILELRDLGYSYNQIVEKLGCSKSTVSYHCGEGQKLMTNKRTAKRNFKHKVEKKVGHYKEVKPMKYKSDYLTIFKSRIYQKLICFFGGSEMNISADYIIDRITQNPFCELTGLPLDVENTGSWHLDHKLPRSRGGDNSVENLQILSAKANLAKSSMTNKEFIELCRLVVEHNSTGDRTCTCKG